MLPKSQRLRSNRDFRRTYARGRSYVHPLLILYVLPNGGCSKRIGFSISKKLGGAVERNRIKRRLREACRARAGLLKPGFDAVLVGRGRIRDEPFESVQAAVDDLFRRARLVTTAAPPGTGEVPRCGESASE